MFPHAVWLLYILIKLLLAPFFNIVGNAKVVPVTFIFTLWMLNEKL